MEEAPTPETHNEPEGDIEHLKKFSATYKENIKYEIIIYKRGTHFIIETEIPKDSQTIKYSNYYDLDSLKQTNRFLALCDSIDDIIDTIYENASALCNIIESHNDYEIKIPVPVKNIKEITFILKEKKKTQNEIINDLVSNSIKLNNKIEKQAKKINEMETKIKNLEEENKKIDEMEAKIKNLEEGNEKINEMETKIKNLEEENKKIKSEFKGIIDELKTEKEKELAALNEKLIPLMYPKSKILMSHEFFEKLNNWINPSKLLTFKLIFTASINGVSAKDFHKYCDGKGPTVTIVKAKNGHIFGGYVTVPFSSDCKSHYDDKAFLFSLTNMKKFPIKIKEQAVCHYSDWGPYIGYKDKCDLAIYKGCLNNKTNYCEPTSYEFERVDLIGNSDKYFVVEDYEVYLVK